MSILFRIFVIYASMECVIWSENDGFDRKVLKIQNKGDV